MDQEISAWTNYFNYLLDNNNLSLYVKGGNVLGLAILKIFIDYPNFDDIYCNICRLKLINDWDFVVYGMIPDNDFFTMSHNQFNINKEGEKIIVMRYKTPKERSMINGEALFELSVKHAELMSSLEIPLTSMKIQITKTNICEIFELVRLIRSSDCVITIKKIINSLSLIIPECDVNGLFNLTHLNFDDGNLSDELLKLIGNENIVYTQFLVSQIKEPDRLFLRFIGKNLPKSKKIQQFLSNHMVKYQHQPWLLDENNIVGIIDAFNVRLKNHIDKILNDFITEIDEIHLEMDILVINRQITECKLEVMAQKFDYYYLVDTLKSIYSESDSAQIFNEKMINHSAYKIIFSNPSIIYFQKMKSLVSINAKIMEFEKKQAICEKYNITYANCSYGDLVTINTYNYKIIQCKKSLAVIYTKLLTRYSDLFVNVNIGRLADTMEKFNVESIDKIMFVFGDVARYIRLDFVKVIPAVASFHGLLCKIHKMC